MLHGYGAPFPCQVRKKTTSNTNPLRSKREVSIDADIICFIVFWNPVIASTHGVCLGGGLQIALGADFRFTTPDCKFSVMEAKVLSYSFICE